MEDFDYRMSEFRGSARAGSKLHSRDWASARCSSLVDRSWASPRRHRSKQASSCVTSSKILARCFDNYQENNTSMKYLNSVFKRLKSYQLNGFSESRLLRNTYTCGEQVIFITKLNILFWILRQVLKWTSMTVDLTSKCSEVPTNWGFPYMEQFLNKCLFKGPFSNLKNNLHFLRED